MRLAQPARRGARSVGRSCSRGVRNRRHRMARSRPLFPRANPGSDLVREHHDISGSRSSPGRSQRKTNRVPTRNPRTHRGDSLLHSLRPAGNKVDNPPNGPDALLCDSSAGDSHRRTAPAIRPEDVATAMSKNATSRKDARLSPSSPPSAARKPHQVPSPNGARNDSYYWLRDDTRKSKEVLKYLNDENAYTNSVLAPTQALQDELYEELVGRIKQDDASVPVLRRGWWYYTRYETGREYPIYARRRRTMSAPEHVMLDGNALATGKSFYQIGAWSVSPNGRMLAYAEDDVGRRQYKLKVMDLVTGKALADTVANIEPNLVWANDNRTLLYVEKDPVTLL